MRKIRLTSTKDFIQRYRKSWTLQGKWKNNGRKTEERSEAQTIIKNKLLTLNKNTEENGSSFPGRKTEDKRKKHGRELEG